MSEERDREPKEPDESAETAPEDGPGTGDPAELVDEEGADRPDGIRAEREELEALRDRHLRLAAEFENYRKRTRRELADSRERAQADLAAGILEVLDDLNRVREAPPETTTVDALHEGVDLVFRKLEKGLADAGLSRIEAVDRPFDPQLHDALLTTPVDDPEDDEIVSRVLLEGYRFGDRVLRPARVEVKKYSPDVRAADAES